jgi:hypothetical protein
MLKNKFKLLIIILLTVISTINSLNAQNRIHSPYSRFGLGDLQPYSNSQYVAMGGIGYAIGSSTSVNFLNPASYTKFDSLSFIFEGGMLSNFTTLETSTLSQKSNYTSLSYLTFGFPINSWWKASFGLLPFSSVGYKITDHQVDPNFGNVDFKYEGQGGINQFFIGQAIKINSNLSFGVNVSYLFGTVDKIRSIHPLDSAYVFDVKVKNSITYGNFNFNFGLQYFKNLKNDYIFGSGIVFSNAMNSSVKEDYLAYSFSETSSGYEYIHDTSLIAKESDIKSDIHLPLSLGIGLSLEKRNKWLIGADFNWQNWESYTYNDVKDSLSNSIRISIGGMIKPNIYSTNYLKRITYKAGFRYSPTYLKLDGEQIDEFGISFGVGLPLRKSKSTINLGVEIGKRGTTNNGLISENFTKFTIGFSAYDFWFYKRKFD